MMEAARTSKTSVDNYFTRQYIPEDNSELHTRRRENLKSHMFTHSSHSYIFTATVQCKTSAFGYKPRRTLRVVERFGKHAVPISS
jgi:hypothetical protein